MIEGQRDSEAREVDKGRILPDSRKQLKKEERWEKKT